MKRYSFPDQSQYEEIVCRPRLETAAIEKKVEPILAAVKEQGDVALREFTQRFDGVLLESLWVSESEISDASAQLAPELCDAIRIARKNIESFHRSQIALDAKVETMPGVYCWRRSIPLERVGFYVPGGSAPLFSTALMMAVPAVIAGCQDIVVCTPPGRDGKINPAILFTLSELGITRIMKVGGAQAIAALAYGTESIAAVQKIFGPGNQYVTVAKQLVSRERVAIDMPAGPSEVAVIADESADPGFVAADLLAQAEHGSDSQVLLVSTSEQLLNAVEGELEKQLATLPRSSFAREALASSNFVQVRSLQDGFALINHYAPEHLIILTKNPSQDASQVINAGSVFLGQFSPESVGDYASGTNHILPTNGYAACLSGVSLDSFVRKVTFQELTQAGLVGIGDAVQLMARAEGLEGHARAVSIRLGGKDV
jgi:histidinol dehydrogenase